MYSFLWMIWILYVRCVDDFVLIIFEKEFMIPKIIHLCWFSEESFPVEIKMFGKLETYIAGLYDKVMDICRCIGNRL